MNDLEISMNTPIAALMQIMGRLASYNDGIRLRNELMRRGYTSTAQVTGWQKIISHSMKTAA